MAMIAVFFNVDGQRVAHSLHEAAEKLEGTEGEAVLDFAFVRRIDSHALQAIRDLAQIAEQKRIEIVFREVHVDVYKTLKLARLTQPFSFES